MNINSEGIKFVQRTLNGIGNQLVVDGNWGPKTQQAFIRALFNKSEIRPDSFGELIVSIAEKEIGFKESSGENRGVDIPKYQSATWLIEGSWPWCAAFVDWVVRQALNTAPLFQLKVPEINRPMTASAWDLENWALSESKRTKNVRLYKPIDGTIHVGDILVYTFSHCGIAYAEPFDDSVRTIEGNTNKAGSREGDGVWSKLRKLSDIRSIIRIGKINYRYFNDGGPDLDPDDSEIEDDDD